MTISGEDVIVAQDTCGLSGCDEPVGDGYIVVGMDGEGRVQHHVAITICDTHHARLTEGILDSFSIDWAPKPDPYDAVMHWEMDSVRPVE